jgi:hypothetical protein
MEGPQDEVKCPINSASASALLATQTAAQDYYGAAQDYYGMATIMKIDPTPSDREVLTGLVERVTYHNAENGFCVLRVEARGHRELVTLVGHAAAISAGEWITASGNSGSESPGPFRVCPN